VTRKRGTVAAVSGQANREREQIRGIQQLEDRLSRAFGIVASATGLLLVVGGMSPSYAGPAGGIGLVFGALSYLLGARRLGAAVMVVSVAEIVIGPLT
jgi:hypothetical protein